MSADFVNSDSSSCSDGRCSDWLYQEAVKCFLFHSTHSKILDAKTYSRFRLTSAWHNSLIDYVIAPMRAKRRFTTPHEVVEGTTIIRGEVLPNGKFNGSREFFNGGGLTASDFVINGKILNHVEFFEDNSVSVFTLSDKDDSEEDEFLFTSSKVLTLIDTGEQPYIKTVINTAYGNVNLDPVDPFIFKRKDDITMVELQISGPDSVVLGEYIQLGDLRVAKRNPGPVVYMLTLKSDRLELKFITKLSVASRLMGDSNDMFYTIKTAFNDNNLEQLEVTVRDISSWYDWEIEKITVFGDDWQ